MITAENAEDAGSLDVFAISAYSAVKQILV
jgi:hypothetical protein